MINKLRELKTAMESEEETSQKLSELKKLFEDENKDLLERQKELRETISIHKNNLKIEVEEKYKIDGIKKRLGGLGIRISKVLDYTEEKALAWAKEKDLCLKLDIRAFEGFAKTGEIDFVEIKEKVLVTFPKKIILEKECD